MAIIGTGVQYNHPDLGGGIGPGYKVDSGYDFADNDPYPIDNYGNYGHDSEVAGIVGALTNNAETNGGYVAGIAGGWNLGPNDIGVSLCALKIYKDVGNEWGGDDIAAEAIWKAADPNYYNCSVLNCAWGKSSYIEGAYSEVLRKAFHWAYIVGASIVASKGNDGLNWPYFPADYDYHWITAVGSYGKNGIFCTENNCDLPENVGWGIDIVAPGVDIPSTDKWGEVYFTFGATSAAAAHVSGVIGLIRSSIPGLHNEDTEWLLKFTAYDAKSDNNVWTKDNFYGHGALRASTVMQRINNPQYQFYQHTAVGGIIHDTIAMDSIYTFIGGPFSGRLNVDVFEVWVPVIYPEEFQQVPYVWGIGHNSFGRSEKNPNYHDPYCEVVPGSQHIAGCTLKTYVYYIDTYPLNWYPDPPDQLRLNYKIWGIKKLKNQNGPEGGKLEPVVGPSVISLINNYPDSFNSATNIEFNTPGVGPVTVEIYDLLGRKIETLVSGVIEAGKHTVRWEAVDIPSGIYYIKMTANAEVATDKMILLR